MTWVSVTRATCVAAKWWSRGRPLSSWFLGSFPFLVLCVRDSQPWHRRHSGGPLSDAGGRGHPVPRGTLSSLPGVHQEVTTEVFQMWADAAGDEKTPWRSMSSLCPPYAAHTVDPQLCGRPCSMGTGGTRSPPCPPTPSHTLWSPRILEVSRCTVPWRAGRKVPGAPADQEAGTSATNLTALSTGQGPQG